MQGNVRDVQSAIVSRSGAWSDRREVGRRGRVSGTFRSRCSQGPGKCGAVHENGQPEDDLERQLSCLVAEHLLGGECAGPAAEQGPQVQRGFGDSASALSGRGFVEGIEDEGNDAGNSVEANQQCRMLHHGIRSGKSIQHTGMLAGTGWLGNARIQPPALARWTCPLAPARIAVSRFLRIGGLRHSIFRRIVVCPLRADP